MKKFAEKLRKYLKIYEFDLIFVRFLLLSLVFLLLGILVAKWLLVFAFLAFCPIIAYCIYKQVSYLPRILFYALNLDVKKSIRFVFLSDLHFHEFMPQDYYKKVFDKVNKLNSDAILLGGDFVHDRNTDFTQLQELKRLNAKYKIGVLGNHDYDIEKSEFAKDIITEKHYEYANQVKKELEKNDIQILRNENIKIYGINIFGLDSLWAKKNDISKYEPAEHNIIIAHNPRLFEQMNKNNSKKVDLVLCGHNHGGGQIRFNKWISLHILMGLIQPIWLKGFGRWVAGEYKNKNGLRMVLSKGLGLTGLSVRVNCPPEITVIEIS